MANTFKASIKVEGQRPSEDSMQAIMLSSAEKMTEFLNAINEGMQVGGHSGLRKRSEVLLVEMRSAMKYVEAYGTEEGQL